MSRRHRIVVTCEHATAAVPARWRASMRGADAALASHRGWDPGAEPFARALAEALDAPLVLGRSTRLLVDLNRSPHNPRRFSEWTRVLDRAERAELDTGLHAPHLADVLAACAGAPSRPVVHVAVHSFDPTLHASRHGVEVGILYDPARPLERVIGPAWAAALRARGVATRRNFPYLGKTDGLATWLRGRLAASCYAGFELELSQAWSRDAAARRRRLEPVTETLLRSIAQLSSADGSRAGSRRR